uniref:ARAD1C31482p n=1 Tax=Blastobotrys adeninivorans TaxID=409370 RepID=A0A060T2F7_BLAAD
MDAWNEVGGSKFAKKWKAIANQVANQGLVYLSNEDRAEEYWIYIRKVVCEKGIFYNPHPSKYAFTLAYVKEADSHFWLLIPLDSAVTERTWAKVYIQSCARVDAGSIERLKATSPVDFASVRLMAAEVPQNKVMPLFVVYKLESEETRVLRTGTPLSPTKRRKTSDRSDPEVSPVRSPKRVVKREAQEVMIVDPYFLPAEDLSDFTDNEGGYYNRHGNASDNDATIDDGGPRVLPTFDISDRMNKDNVEGVPGPIKEGESTNVPRSNGGKLRALAVNEQSIAHYERLKKAGQLVSLLTYGEPPTGLEGLVASMSEGDGS